MINKDVAKDVKKAIDVVEKINEEILEQVDDDEFQGLEVMSNGVDVRIDFLGHQIWSYDIREYLFNASGAVTEEFEPIENHLRREIMVLRNSVSKINV